MYDVYRDPVTARQAEPDDLDRLILKYDPQWTVLRNDTKAVIDQAIDRASELTAVQRIGILRFLKGEPVWENLPPRL